VIREQSVKLKELESIANLFKETDDSKLKQLHDLRSQLAELTSNNYKVTLSKRNKAPIYADMS